MVPSPWTDTRDSPLVGSGSEGGVPARRSEGGTDHERAAAGTGRNHCTPVYTAATTTTTATTHAARRKRCGVRRCKRYADRAWRIDLTDDDPPGKSNLLFDPGSGRHAGSSEVMRRSGWGGGGPGWLRSWAGRAGGTALSLQVTRTVGSVWPPPRGSARVAPPDRRGFAVRPARPGGRSSWRRPRAGVPAPGSPGTPRGCPGGF